MHGQWKPADYCRALYSDGLYYEAKVVRLKGNFCTVEFLGYEEIKDVDCLHMKKSGGKNARRRQIIQCLEEETFDDNSSVLDFRSCDWDDSQLIRAFDKGLSARKANQKDKNSSKKDKYPTWNVGDYCKALYTDGLYYEAKVVFLNGSFCTVEFLGYEEFKDVHRQLLKESEGKNARKRQIIQCLEEETSDDSSFILDDETAGDETDATVVSHCNLYRKKNSHVNQSANNTTFDTITYEATCQKQYSAAPAPVPYYAPPIPTANLPFMAPPAAVPQFSAPIPPPMPQCPSVANNPKFMSMLASWYLAGYYTGIYSAQKENHGCKCCCKCSSQCHRN